MAASRPLEDHSPQVQRLRQGYGGSRRSAPFFRTPETVHYNSLAKARDLGAFAEWRGVVSGVIGSVCGTNTHFLRLTLTAPAKVGARLVGANACAIDWLCLHAADHSGKPLAIGPSGFLFADPLRAEPASADASTLTIISFDAYTQGNYFEADYVPEFITLADSAGTLTTIDLATYLYQQELSAALASDAADELASRSSLADHAPAGTYLLLVSTDRWHETPYTLQIVVLSGSTELGGSLDLEGAPSAGTGTVQLAADAGGSFSPSARLRETVDLGPSLDLTFSPRGGLAVVTPVD